MMRLFPDAFAGQSISPVGNYPERLLENLRAVAPSGADDPVVVLLTPGRYNSAYFEQVFLAEQMGIELIEGGELFVRDGYVGCAPPKVRSRSTSSTAASTMSSWIRWLSAPTPRSACLACCRSSAAAGLRLPMRSAPASLGDERDPGGLTRVALRKGSLVVNSSQGGGTKDTWVLERASC